MEQPPIISDLFWSIDPNVLIRPDRFIEFWPRSDLTLEERLNAIARLGIYIGIVVCLYHRDFKYLYISLLFLVLTQFLYSQGIEDQKENFEDDTSATKNVKPTLNNPFMNTSIVDISDNPKKEKSPIYADNSAESQQIRKDIDDKFGYNLYKDVSELFGVTNSQRQFYTTPSTTIPNDRDSFAKWLYGSSASCKDQMTNCMIREDVRGKRPQFVNPDVNPVK